jgi:hypothetical protein
VLRSFPAASLLAVVLLAGLGFGAFALGRHERGGAITRATGATASRTASGAAATPPTTRAFDDPRFEITFRYPSELRPVATHLRDRERGRPVVASTGLYSPRIGYLELTRINDDLTGPALDINAPILTRQIAAIVRRDAPRVAFRARAHALHHLPVVELRPLGPPREVLLNVFTWTGRNGYRLICHANAQHARRLEMLRICQTAMRTLAVRPVMGPADAGPGTRRPS